MWNILSIETQPVRTHNDFFLLDFGVPSFLPSLGGAGLRREQEASFEQEEQKAQTFAEWPSLKTIEDILIPQNTGILEKKAFFGKAAVLNSANLGYLALSVQAIVNSELSPRHLISKPLDFPARIYSGYAAEQQINAFYQAEQTYEPSIEVAPYQPTLQDAGAKPYSLPLPKPQDIPIAQLYADVNFVPKYDMPKQVIQALDSNFWQTGVSFIGFYKPQARLFAAQDGITSPLENIIAKPSVKFLHIAVPQELPQPLTQRVYRAGVDHLVNFIFTNPASYQTVPKYQIFVITPITNNPVHKPIQDISKIIMKASSSEVRAQQYLVESQEQKDLTKYPEQKNQEKPTIQGSKKSNVVYLNDYRQPRRRDRTQEWQPKDSKREYRPRQQYSKLRGKPQLNKSYLPPPTLRNAPANLSQESNGRQNIDNPNENLRDENHQSQPSNNNSGFKILYLKRERGTRADVGQNEVARARYHTKIKGIAKKGSDNLASFVRNTYDGLKSGAFLGDLYSRARNIYSKTRIEIGKIGQNIDSLKNKYANANPMPSKTEIKSSQKFSSQSDANNGVQALPEGISGELGKIFDYFEKTYGCKVSFVAKDVSTGYVFARKNANEMVSNGSMSKIGIIRTILELSQKGEITLDDEVELHNSLRPKNFGPSKEKVTYREIAREIYSDEHKNSNRYANEILAKFGILRINKMMHEMGYANTVFTDYYLPQANNRGNKTSMDDGSNIMMGLETGKGLDEEHHKAAWEIMNGERLLYSVRDTRNLAGLDPKGTSVKHGNSSNDISTNSIMRGTQDGREFGMNIAFTLSGLKKTLFKGDCKTATPFGVEVVRDYLKFNRQINLLIQTHGYKPA